MSFEKSNEIIVGSGGLPASRDSGQFFFAPNGRVRSTELSLDDAEGRVSLPQPQRPFLIVGRSDRCDVVLDHEDISFRHAYLQLIGGHVYCVDLASRSGTFWDGKRKASGWVKHSVPVSIGPYTIQSRPPEFGPTMATGLLDEDLLSTDSFDRYPSCYVELTFLNSRSNRSKGQKWRIRQPITLVGNASRCRMRLNHKSVSRVHCSLMVTPQGLWVADLLGKSGTWVNEQPVDFQLLHDGDEVRVGDFRFVVSYGQTIESQSRSQSVRNDEQPVPPQAKPQNTDYQPSNSKPSGGGLSEEFMLSMMDRFSAMQQQMTTMSHQQMMVMAQLVGTMHQNHHDLVQQEMARINQIGEQIKDLQGQIAAEPKPRPDAAQTAVDESPVAAIPFVEGSKPPIQLPAAPATEESLNQSSPAPAEPAEDVAPTPTANAPLRDRAAPRNAESHSELIERMAALETERTSRWKRVMQILTGSGP